jgi:hypothetical protein
MVKQGDDHQRSRAGDDEESIEESLPEGSERDGTSGLHGSNWLGNSWAKMSGGKPNYMGNYFHYPCINQALSGILLEAKKIL